MKVFHSSLGCRMSLWLVSCFSCPAFCEVKLAAAHIFWHICECFDSKCYKQTCCLYNVLIVRKSNICTAFLNLSRPGNQITFVSKLGNLWQTDFFNNHRVLWDEDEIWWEWQRVYQSVPCRHWQDDWHHRWAAVGTVTGAVGALKQKCYMYLFLCLKDLICIHGNWYCV